MHLLETFALSTGTKIDKPYILEKFFPLGLKGDYITFRPFGKMESRKYEYWNEVTNILYPILNANNINIVQLGGPEEQNLDKCVPMNGQTTFNQMAYIINRGALHLGVDSLGVHVASGFGKKIVGLYCNMYTQNSRPYWSDDEDVILLEADRKGNKPTFSGQESPKTINTIYPETIAESVCKLLGIEFNYPYKTLYIGENFSQKTFELIPNYPVDPSSYGFSSVIVRMDLEFNEQMLWQQLMISPCSIMTNRSIDVQKLLHFKNNIKEFVYLIDKNSNPDYVKALSSAGIKPLLMSFLDEDDLNKYKLDYIDHGRILQRPNSSREDIKEIKNKKDDKLFYKSSRHYILGQQLFWTKSPNFDSKPIKDENRYIPQPLNAGQNFWDDNSVYHILEKA